MKVRPDERNSKVCHNPKLRKESVTTIAKVKVRHKSKLASKTFSSQVRPSSLKTAQMDKSSTPVSPAKTCQNSNELNIFPSLQNSKEAFTNLLVPFTKLGERSLCFILVPTLAAGCCCEDLMLCIGRWEELPPASAFANC
jgi:hypothetical protein